MRVHVSQESRANEMMELLVIYNIELVSYFLPIPIVIRRHNLLLPLAEPYTSEIITNPPSTASTPLARTD